MSETRLTNEQRAYLNERRDLRRRQADMLMLKNGGYESPCDQDFVADSAIYDHLAAVESELAALIAPVDPQADRTALIQAAKDGRIMGGSPLNNFTAGWHAGVAYARQGRIDRG